MRDSNVSDDYNYDHRHDHEYIHEYTAYDLEVDLLNIYSSAYMFNQSMTHDTKVMNDIQQKYTKLKNKHKQYLITNTEIKNLISEIDCEMNIYKNTLTNEVQKYQTVYNRFKFGLGFGLGLCFGVGLSFTYINKTIITKLLPL
jgi:hypothetical protein